MKYFEVFNDMEREDYRWLGLPVHPDGAFVDTRKLRAGENAFFDAPVIFPVKRSGSVAELFLATMGILVAGPVAAKVLHSIAKADIQLIPATTKDGDDLMIINILNVLNILDRERSQIVSFPRDHSDTALAGKPRMITNLVLKDVSTSHHLFRILDWPVPVIVSGEVKSALSELESVRNVIAWREICN